MKFNNELKNEVWSVIHFIFFALCLLGLDLWYAQPVMAEEKEHLPELPVERIVIDSGVSGWSTSQSKMEIIRRAGEYFSDGAPVPKEKIENLLKAVRAPVKPAFHPSLLDIDSHWLKEKLPKAMEEFKQSRYRDKNIQCWVNCTPAVKQEFAKSFLNLHLIHLILVKQFCDSGIMTDYYPWVLVEITFSEGKILKTFTNSQQTLMLPWTVLGPQRKGITFDDEIAKAVQDLMSDKMINKGKLSTQNLLKWMARGDIPEVRAQHMLFAREMERMEQLGRFKKDYIILEPPYEKTLDWYRFMVRKLRKKNWPENLRVHAEFYLNEGNLKTNLPDDPLGKMEAIAKRLHDIPWLKSLLKKRPDIQVEFHFPPKSGERFKKETLEPLQRVKRFEVIKWFEPLLDKITPVRIYAQGWYTDWILLPDGRMMYFTAPGLRDSIDWAPNKPEAHEVFKERNGFVFATGAVVLPSGQLEGEEVEPVVSAWSNGWRDEVFEENPYRTIAGMTEDCHDFTDRLNAQKE